MRMTFEWIVTAGREPGEALPEFTRRFELSAAEYDNGRAGLEEWLAREAAATAYARHLQLSMTVRANLGWTEVAFKRSVAAG